MAHVENGNHPTGGAGTSSSIGQEAQAEELKAASDAAAAADWNWENDFLVQNLFSFLLDAEGQQ
jgi:hypothetical protein